MVILGLSAYYHDSAAAIIVDGDIVAAASEERFTRIKGDASFPVQAVKYCLQTANVTLDDVDHIVFYENTFLKFSRILTIAHAVVPYGLRQFLVAVSKWVTNDLWIDAKIKRQLNRKKINLKYCEHHLSHAASAFYPSPFEEAAVLVIDGVGEWATVSIGKGLREDIEILEEIHFPHSIGILYSAFTLYLGFKINFGEYKVMGLAPYGEPNLKNIILSELVQLNEDGSFFINQEYFNYTKGVHTYNKKFECLFGNIARKEGQPLTQFHMDLAASIQAVCNELVMSLVRRAKQLTNLDYLCMAGGVALNVVSVGNVIRSEIFKRVWVQPASGDAGGALGGALWAHYMSPGVRRIANESDSMKGCLLGPEIGDKDDGLDQRLREYGASWEMLNSNHLSRKVAELLAQGKIVALARGRMEWGPRALGCRSILADARVPAMQKTLNLKIKYRESFRPFAPIVLKEDAADYFDMCKESPYMLSTYQVSDRIRVNEPRECKVKGFEALEVPRSEIPAVTHLDLSARVQTVDAERFSFLHSVLTSFKKETGCSVLINTSFNIRGEPIVCDGIDALKSFVASQIDYLVIGNRLFDRGKQSNHLLSYSELWRNRFELD